MSYTSINDCFDSINSIPQGTTILLHNKKTGRQVTLKTQDYFLNKAASLGEICAEVNFLDVDKSSRVINKITELFQDVYPKTEMCGGRVDMEYVDAIGGIQPSTHTVPKSYIIFSF